jgi:secreted Zn-dependent insulinase-like peptidase
MYADIRCAALLCTGQVGLSSQDLRLRVLTDLADQLLCEPLYDTLRTKQQLGYSVSSGARLTYGVSGFCVVVVSAAFEADEVERHIEDFLHSYQQTLQVTDCEAALRRLNNWHSSAGVTGLMGSYMHATAVHQPPMSAQLMV